MRAQKVSRLAPAVAVNEPLGELRCLLGGRLSDSKRPAKAQALTVIGAIPTRIVGETFFKGGNAK
jgi:hypothetical protein